MLFSDSNKDLELHAHQDADPRKMVSNGLDSILDVPATGSATAVKSFPNTFLDMLNLMKLVRGLGLYVSDSISFDFRMDFSMLDMEQKEVAWKDFSKELPAVSYYSEVEWRGSAPFLLGIDEAVIHALTGRLLGTAGYKTDDIPKMTFAEKFVGEELVQLILKYFLDLKHDLTCVKTDPELSYFHTFYPDDSVLAVQLKCNINQEFIGNVTMCLSKSVLQQS